MKALNNRFRIALVALLAVASCVSLGQKSPDSGANSAVQTAADILREAAKTDGAFIAAGIVKESFSSDNLASMLIYPSDEVVIVSLSGATIRAAFERSLSLYPQGNAGFLQISGFEVSFEPSAAVGRRVKGVMVGTSRLDESKVYTIAMPASLGRGGLGYFKLWDKTKITSTLSNLRMDQILSGKKAADTKPRWVAGS